MQQTQTREPQYFGSLITSSNPSRAILIAVHRERYRVHAQATLDKADAREIYYQDDCGWSWHPIEFGYIKRIEFAMGFDKDTLQDERRALCTSIANETAVPALEAVLDDYVTWLTGRKE